MTQAKHGEAHGESWRRLVAKSLNLLGRSKSEGGEGAPAKPLKSLRRRLAKVAKRNSYPIGGNSAPRRITPWGFGRAGDRS